MTPLPVLAKASLAPLLGAATPEGAGKLILDRSVKRADILSESGATEGAIMLLLEAYGGKCPYCSEPWRKVSVDNPFSRYDYYQPACHCYVRCWHCGHLHIEEKAAHREVVQCANCGIPLGWSHRGPTPICPHTEPIDRWVAKEDRKKGKRDEM